MMNETVTIEEVARTLRMNPQGVRIQLQRGILPFGYAVPTVTGKGFRYIIPRAKFDEFLGRKEKE